MLNTVREDIKTVFSKDPAARSLLEVLTCYPGLHAIWNHRIASFFWRNHLKLLGRIISHCGRFVTGIEIHPGATIGKRLFIDHGAGVVIGETSVIKDDVLLYQGVVLGGTSLKKGKRHPTLEENVVIGAGAIVLGDIVISKGSKVGAGSVVVKSAPPGVTVVGVPGRVVDEHRKMVIDLEHGKLPDPVAEAVRVLLAEQQLLGERLEKLEKTSGKRPPTDELRDKIREIKEEFNQS